VDLFDKYDVYVELTKEYDVVRVPLEDFLIICEALEIANEATEDE
jgi:hypothetical protein